MHLTSSRKLVKSKISESDSMSSLTGLEAKASRVFHPFSVTHELRQAPNYRQLVANPQFAARFVAEVCEIVESKKIEAFSFDVFDTALMRSPLSEARRFLNVADSFAAELGGRFSATDALIARATAARAAYTFSARCPDGTCEGTLSLIAKIACSQLGVPDEVERYIKTEIEYERENLSANPMIRALLEAFPKMPVVFLSDMYLESDLIRGLLAADFGKKVRVISSADGYGSKRCGGLYEFAEHQLNLRGDRTLHFGDSLESDYRQAKRNGWNAFYLPISNTERAARRDCYDSVVSSFAIAGIALHPLLSFNC